MKKANSVLEDQDLMIQKLRELKTEFDADESAAKKTKERQQSDMRYSSGSNDDMWGDNDRAIRGKDRAEVSVPLLGQVIQKAVAQYVSSPFGINISETNATDGAQVEEWKQRIRKVEANSSAVDANVSSVMAVLSCGEGFGYVTTESIRGKLMTTINGVFDSTRMTLDRNAKKNDASDARRAWYRDSMSLKEAKSTYGDDVIGVYGLGLFLDDTSRNLDSADCPIITLWMMESDNVCCIYKIVGNKIIDKTDIPMPFLPVYRFSGIPALINGRKENLSKIHGGIGLLRMVNYAAALGMERLATSPKNPWVADAESISPYMDVWSRNHKANIGVLPFDSQSADGSRKFIPPMKQNVGSDLNDVMGLQTTYTQMLSQVVGDDDINGGQGRLNETAEAAILRNKSSESSISLIYRNIAAGIKQQGRIVVCMEAWVRGEEIDIDSFEFDVDAGPMLATQKKDNLRSVLSIAQIAGETYLPVLLGDIAKNSDGLDEGTVKLMQQLSANAAKAMLAPAVGAGGDPMQIQALQQQAAQAASTMAEMTAKIHELNQYAAYLQNALDANQAKVQADLLMNQQDNETRLQVEAMKLDGAQNIEQQKILNAAEMNRQKIEGDLTKAVMAEQASARKEIDQTVNVPILHNIG